MKTSYKTIGLFALLAVAGHVSAAELPQYQVGPFNFNKTSVQTALKTVFEGTGIEVDAVKAGVAQVTAKGLTGPLNLVMDKIAKSGDFEYSYDGKHLTVISKSVAQTAMPATMSRDLGAYQEESKPAYVPAPVQAIAPRVYYELSVEDADVSVSLQRWAKSAGWQVIWEVPVKFPVLTNTRFEGSFEDAVAQVVEGLKESDTPIRAKFYEGNRVLRIIENNGDQ